MKELLQLMLDNPRYFKNGLCVWAESLYLNGIISYAQLDLLFAYIQKNKPSIFSSIDAFKHKVSNNKFYWTMGDIAPRIKWLKKHINKN